jgi:hypothetical protein
MKLDSIFKALGIDSVEDVEKLTVYFVKSPNQKPMGAASNSTLADSSVNISRAHMSSGSGIPGAVISADMVMIPPDQVINTLRSFLDDQRREALLNEDEKFGKVDHVVIGDDSKLSQGERAVTVIKKKQQHSKSKKASTAGGGSAKSRDRERTRRTMERRYWESMTEIISEENSRIWEVPVNPS